MNRNLLAMVLTATFLTGCVAVHESKHTRDNNPAGICPYAAAAKPAQVLRHVVLVKFKDGTTTEQIRQIENTFSAMPSKIDVIYDYEWGTDVSVENLQQGFTHCFILTFRSEADRGVYLPHPVHKELGTLVDPYLDKILVVDYWTKQ